MGVTSIFSRKRSQVDTVDALGTAANANALRIDRSLAVEVMRATQDELELRVKQLTAELEKQVIERHKAEDRLRELTTRVLQLQDDERRRIARELHDSAGQYLAAIQMNLSALERESSTLAQSQAKRISDSIEMVNLCTSEIRTLSYLLHPPQLDEIGLSSALKWYSDGFAERSGIRINLQIPKDFGRLARDAEIALFRIVQQSLANIYRHSGSPTAKIKLRQDSEETAVEICDEGRGITPEVLKQFKDGTRLLGVGMAGMRERIRAMNGQFKITSSQKGTRIEVRLPNAAAEPLAPSTHSA